MLAKTNGALLRPFHQNAPPMFIACVYVVLLFFRGDMPELAMAALVGLRGRVAKLLKDHVSAILGSNL